MKKKVLRKISPIFFLILILIGVGISFFFTNSNHVEALSKYGSSGEEVRQIQTKLKRWGYYTGSIDGIYGSKTMFQINLTFHKLFPIFRGICHYIFFSSEKSI